MEMMKEDIPFKNYSHMAKMEAGFHFTIDGEGRWYCHDPAMGVGPIKNERIAALFSGAAAGKFAGKGLSRDAEGKYWLKAPPNDVYGVEVEDVPFVILSYRQEGDRIILITNFHEEVALDADRSLISRDNIPYIEIRDRLFARLGRNVYYALANIAEEVNGKISVQSGGVFHALGNSS